MTHLFFTQLFSLSLSLSLCSYNPHTTLIINKMCSLNKFSPRINHLTQKLVFSSSHKQQTEGKQLIAPLLSQRFVFPGSWLVCQLNTLPFHCAGKCWPICASFYLVCCCCCCGGGGCVAMPAGVWISLLALQMQFLPSSLKNRICKRDESFFFCVFPAVCSGISYCMRAFYFLFKKKNKKLFTYYKYSKKAWRGGRGFPRMQIKIKMGLEVVLLSWRWVWWTDWHCCCWYRVPHVDGHLHIFRLVSSLSSTAVPERRRLNASFDVAERALTNEPIQVFSGTSSRLTPRERRRRK